MLVTDYAIILVTLFVGMFLSIKFKKLTTNAALTGGLLGFIIFVGTGYFGIVMLASFFTLGTLATSHKLKLKQGLGLAEIDKGKRTTGQVIANAGVAAILSILAIAFPANEQVFKLMIAGSFSAATADTLSSELGNVYGRNFYNIISFKKDKRGLNGVVSLEGTMIGIAGSIIIATIYLMFNNISENIIWIIIAGTIGNIIDSILGATIENKGLINNNSVNFANTATGAVAALFLFLFK